MESIQIAIVDDHTLFRNGVNALMSEFPGINVVFEAENGKQMQQKLLRHTLPQVVLMDINMPEMDGYESAAWLRSNYPGIRVLALSMFEDDQAVVRMIRAGAGGYILKECQPLELFEAISRIVKTGVYINEMVSGKLIRSMSGNETSPLLTQKETEFLKLCCSELTYKEIAAKMYVSPRTVDNYRESLFLKLNLKSRPGLVMYAIQQGIYKLGN